MAVSVVIRGLDKLARINKSVAPHFKTGILAASTHVKGKIAKYPQATIANDPSQKRWYERGWGPKWKIKAGSWHGVHSSETLGKSWTVTTRNQGFTGVVGTNASYAPFVQSAEKQAKALKRIGWKTDEEVLQEELPTVERFLIQEVEKGLRTP